MTNKHCDIQDQCKILINANTQYDKVVEQNRNLQQELKSEKEFTEYAMKFFDKSECDMIRAIKNIEEIVMKKCAGCVYLKNNTCNNEEYREDCEFFNEILQEINKLKEQGKRDFD